jgi:prepilin-type N-terminal cleavage/methylation domain-containing protein
MMRVERTRAFTLVELLVVVAVVALLMSLLLPAFGRAREQSKLIYCKNNMRSFWTGILAYALDNRDRVPLMEDVNVDNGHPRTGPSADPFDPAFPTTIGNVLFRYVDPKSWLCPAAIDGFPRPGNATAGADTGRWQMSYSFGVWPTGIGDVIPWDQQGGSVIAGDRAERHNYWVFDGRPLRLLDQRRYVRFGVNRNHKGEWSRRYPMIFDLTINESPGPLGNGYRYPHRGVLDQRNDLENWRDEFESMTRTQRGRVQTGRIELFADWERASIFFTRMPEPHKDGF